MRLSTLTEKTREPIWHVTVALLVAVALQFALKDNLVFGSKYAVASLEIALIVVLFLPSLSAHLKRVFAVLLIALVSLANLISLGLVINALFNQNLADGHALLISSVAIYLTNIIVFGIWYWELDNTRDDVPDFSFPQFTNGDKQWRPTFFDYLYVSITNATAFSPTDTLPLTHRAKLLMTLQSIVSLATIVLVTARAVNILS